jgi:hypothetical protein
MKPFTSFHEAVTHWNNFFLEKEAMLLQIEPFANLTKEKIETLFQSYQKQLNKHIIFSQQVSGYNSPELTKMLKQRLQGMKQYVDILKNYLLNAHSTNPTEEKERSCNVFIQQALTELHKSSLEKSVYKKLAHHLSLCMDPNQDPKSIIELKEEIQSVLSHPHLQIKQTLEKFAQILCLIEQKMKRVKSLVEPTYKNKLSFLWQELVTSEVECQYFHNKIRRLEQTYAAFIEQENELKEKAVDIQHFKYPFLSLIGEAQRRLAITRWNNMISQVEKIFLAFNLTENTGSLAYQHWPNPTKYLLISSIIPLLTHYRESFNHIESLFELIPKKPLSLLHESIYQRLQENFSEINSTVCIFQSLTPFIKQIQPKNESAELLIKKLELWRKKKQFIINQYSNLPSSSQIQAKDFIDLEVFLFKHDSFEPEILALEKEILNRQKHLFVIRNRCSNILLL